MSKVLELAKKHPVGLWLLLWSAVLGAMALAAPRYGWINPGSRVILTAFAAMTFSFAIGPRKTDALLFVAALLAPLGFASCLAFGKTDAGMVGMLVWAGLTSTVFVHGLTHTDKEVKKRLVKAGLWSLGTIPLVLLFTAIFRHR